MKKITEEMILEKLKDGMPKHVNTIEREFKYRINKMVISRFLNKSNKVKRISTEQPIYQLKGKNILSKTI